MLIIGITAALMAVTGTSVWLAAHRWTAIPAGAPGQAGAHPGRSTPAPPGGGPG